MGISIEGKCAIVTGAANGVGLAIARTFVQAGANGGVAMTHFEHQRGPQPRGRDESADPRGLAVRTIPSAVRDDHHRRGRTVLPKGKVFAVAKGVGKQRHKMRAKRSLQQHGKRGVGRVA